MGICEQNAETFIQLRSRIETILNVLTENKLLGNLGWAGGK